MSRIGKQPIQVPGGVSVSIKGNAVHVKGPKGEMELELRHEVGVSMADGKVSVEPKGSSKLHRSLHGLSRTLVANMVEGVTKGFEKTLEVSGVGFRVQKTGNDATLQLGFSHPVAFVAPAGVNLLVEGTNKIKVQGVDKELVGATAARIRSIKAGDPYKGKGIKYAGEKLRVKAGKGGKAAAKK